jgi:hypothetical protein
MRVSTAGSSAIPRSPLPQEYTWKQPLYHATPDLHLSFRASSLPVDASMVALFSSLYLVQDIYNTSGLWIQHTNLIRSAIRLKEVGRQLVWRFVDQGVAKHRRPSRFPSVLE